MLWQSSFLAFTPPEALQSVALNHDLPSGRSTAEGSYLRKTSARVFYGRKLPSHSTEAGKEDITNDWNQWKAPGGKREPPGLSVFSLWFVAIQTWKKKPRPGGASRLQHRLEGFTAVTLKFPYRRQAFRSICLLYYRDFAKAAQSPSARVFSPPTTK